MSTILFNAINHLPAITTFVINLGGFSLLMVLAGILIAIIIRLCDKENSLLDTNKLAPRFLEEWFEIEEEPIIIEIEECMHPDGLVPCEIIEFEELPYLALIEEALAEPEPAPEPKPKQTLQQLLERSREARETARRTLGRSLIGSSRRCRLAISRRHSINI